MRRPGEVLSRFQLLEHAWDYDYENRSNVVDSYIRLLRRKIDRPFGVESIETVRGRGLPPPRGDRTLSRLPIRLRVTLVFAGIMAVVLAATGLFLRLRLEHNLDQSINQDLQSRSDGLVSLIRTGELHLGEPVRSALKARGASFAQVLTPAGKLYRAPCPARGPAAARLGRGPASPHKCRPSSSAPALRDSSTSRFASWPPRFRSSASS